MELVCGIGTKFTVGIVFGKVALVVCRTRTVEVGVGLVLVAASNTGKNL